MGKLILNLQSILLVLFVVVLSLLVLGYIRTVSVLNLEDDVQVTIRMNTFRRNYLLEKSVKHYLECSSVNQIQIVWSDQANLPPKSVFPTSMLNRFGKERIVFEIHDKDSLSNRFTPKSVIDTQAVLSVDDDVLIPCADLHLAILVWTTNDRTLVGFSPRMIVSDTFSGDYRYLRWQHTWWNGIYSIILTKVALLHKDYLEEFNKLVNPAILTYIDKHRNCEDLAMAYLVAQQSQRPPVWVRGNLEEIGRSGISSGVSHFNTRSECVSLLTNLTGKVPWITGYQKAMPLGSSALWNHALLDYFKLRKDVK